MLVHSSGLPSDKSDLHLARQFNILDNAIKQLLPQNELKRVALCINSAIKRIIYNIKYKL